MNFVTGASELVFSHSVGIFMANPTCYRQVITVALLYPEFDTNWSAGRHCVATTLQGVSTTLNSSLFTFGLLAVTIYFYS